VDMKLEVVVLLVSCSWTITGPCRLRGEAVLDA
jgi:hypothetical protein